MQIMSTFLGIFSLDFHAYIIPIHLYVNVLLTDTNECLSSPCLNVGTCNDRVNGYMCSCRSGFAGDNCEVGKYIKTFLSLTSSTSILYFFPVPRVGLFQ